MRLSDKDLQTLAALPAAEDARTWVPSTRHLRIIQLRDRGLLDTDIEDGGLYARRTVAGDATVKAAQEEVTDVR